MDTVLIPAYEPDEELIRLAKELHEAGFALVVVDDGSGPAYEKIVDQVKAYGHASTAHWLRKLVNYILTNYTTWLLVKSR